MSKELIIDLPDSIYLVFEEIDEPTNFCELSDASWCSEELSDNDVKYIRHDLFEQLEAENAELKRDAKRLNFLLDNRVTIYQVKGKFLIYFRFKNHYGDTKREAIDEAMKNGE